MMVEVGTSAAAAAAAPPPSLLSLCLDVVAASLASDSAGRTGWSGGCGSDGLDGAVNEFQGEEEELLSAEQLAEALPWELLYRLASRLPPAALESLHHAAQARSCSPADTNAVLRATDCNKYGMKRSRGEDFSTAWQALFKLRWPIECDVGHGTLATVDWQQQYWKKHLQEFVIKDFSYLNLQIVLKLNYFICKRIIHRCPLMPFHKCLDEAAGSAMLPSFCGSISELSIPGQLPELACYFFQLSLSHNVLPIYLKSDFLLVLFKFSFSGTDMDCLISIGWFFCFLSHRAAKIKNFIYNSKDIPLQHSSLSYQCDRFGCYARSLRLQSVLFSAETCDLFQHCKVDNLMFNRIMSETEVHGVCLLLSCNVETLMPLEFIHCHLYPEVMDKICKSLCRKGSPNHKIQCFSIKSSHICEPKPGAPSAGLINFLSSGKSLRMLSLNDTKMPPTFSKMIFHTLMESSQSTNS